MDPIKLLLKHHALIRKKLSEINGLLKEVHQGKVEYQALMDSFSLLEEILLVHEKLEQEVFYPNLKEVPGLKSRIEHLKREEKEAEKLLKKIDHTQDKESFIKELKKLMQAVEHHAKEEETKLFPKVKILVSNKTLSDIGEKMHKFLFRATKPRR